MVDKIEDWKPPTPTIPNGWVAVDFEDAFENISVNGKKIKQKQYLEKGDFPVIDQGAQLIGGYTNHTQSQIKIAKPVIVFGDHTRCFKYVDFDFAPGADGIKVLLPKEGCDPIFLFYLCKILKLPNRGYSRHYSFLKKSVLPIAPLNEQKRIVDRIEQLFSDMDKGEELLKTVQKQLATYRQSVLKAAVTGELTKDWREKNKKNLESGEKLLARILESRRKNWQGRGKHKDVPSIDRSELLELPNGWTWATPEHLVSDAPNSLCIGPFGSNLKVDDYTDAGVPLVFVRHIRAKNFDGLKPQYVSAKKAKELSSHKVIGGDILITKMGEPPGDVCIYPENHPDAIITADCIRFSPQRELLDTKYLELALNSRPVQTQIQGITKGVAQQKVTLGNFKKVVIPLPGLDEQKEIANICEEKFSQIYALETWCEAQLSRSNTLRQSILKSAFSGKLVAQDPSDEPASELLARIKSGDGVKTKAKAAPPRRGRKPRSDKSEAA